MKIHFHPLQLPNDDYKPLLVEYIKTILESGLLLDEDYEVLLNASAFKIVPNQPITVPFGLITASLVTLGSSFFAYKWNKPVILLPLLVTSSYTIYLNIKQLIKTKRRRTIVNSVVKSFVKMRKLNTTIIRYLKMRTETKQTYSPLLNVQEFIQYVSTQSIKFFRLTMEQMAFLSGLTKELANDFESIKELNFESVLKVDGDASDNAEILAGQVQDIFTFFASKYLNYLGVTFWKNSTNFMEVLLDNMLPCIIAALGQLHESVQKEFNNLRYCASQKMEIERKSKDVFRKQVSGKLHETLIGAVNSLSIIMEKSREVLEKVDSLEEGGNISQLESALGDLRDHAFATYESLDVLCKLYGILSNANKSRFISQQDEKIRMNLEKADATIETINFDDIREPIEENYELFIPEGEVVATHDQKETSSEDQSGVYVNLMLKELRQSLKQHERFIAARNKRGPLEDEEERGISERVKVEEEPVPKFDLNVFAAKRPVPPPRPSKLNFPLPPPPPPPPPKPTSSSVPAQMDVDSVREKSLFEGIKTLSSQLKGVEEVFGGDFSSDSD